MLSRKIILLSLVTATTALQAATEFPNGLVPADIVAEFAGGTILQGLPDDFPPLTVPAALDLRVIGSMQENAYSQTILLSSSLSREELAAGLRAALTGQGWLDTSVSPGGFPGLGLLRFCHDAHGDLSINGTPTDYGTRLRVSRTVMPAGYPGKACSVQREQIVENAARGNIYDALMPILEVPENTVNSPSDLISGSSSSRSATRVTIRRDGSIEVPNTSTAELHDHFAAQMLEQGWQEDSSDTSDRSAISVWRKALTDPLAIGDTAFVVLTVLRGSEDFYAVMLTVRSMPVDGGTAGIIGISP